MKNLFFLRIFYVRHLRCAGTNLAFFRVFGINQGCLICAQIVLALYWGPHIAHMRKNFAQIGRMPNKNSKFLEKQVKFFPIWAKFFRICAICGPQHNAKTICAHIKQPWYKLKYFGTMRIFFSHRCLYSTVSENSRGFYGIILNK